MTPYDVVTFGETMIRLSPPGQTRLEAAETLDCRVGGSESNTAIALARLGRRVAWWSKLAANPLGRRIEAQIARWGVDTSHILWTETGRVGIYFIEFGAPPRPHQVYYDRADSAASTLAPDEVDWTHLEGARHLHLTGITAALSATCATTVARAVQEARARGLTVSLDVNYRSRLWTPEQARETITPLLADVDILFCPTADAQTVFRLDGTPEQVARGLRTAYSLPTVIVTAGGEGAVAVQGDQALFADAIPSVEVDRVGAGDAFDAGVLHGFLDGNLEKGLRYGVAMAALKRTMPGDELLTTREEIETVMNGAGANIRR